MRPFQNSLEALAEVGARTTGALRYAVLEKGARLDPAPPAVVEYPLRVEGAIVASLVFAFAGNAEALRARPQLAHVAAAVQAIWSFGAKDRYGDLIARVSALEEQLLDSKIADRARGLLTGETESEAIGILARHVERVLRPGSTRFFLERVSSELESEIEERQVVARAKQTLQAADRLSEEQAHQHLRILSRKLRKPLKDVAQRVFDDHCLQEGKTA